MTAPTPATFAEKLARAIHDDIASPLLRAKERLRVFGDLKVTPSISVDPQTGGVSFSFDVGERREDIHATIERLLELPGELAADRKRQVVLVLDEFQEVVEIDRRLPNLMRAVFQRQPEVAHVYLGSKRHMMQRIFNDENEPFWRSAKQVELGVIEREPFAAYIKHQFERTDRYIAAEAVDAILDTTGGHPYATQELCYFAWQETAADERAERRAHRRRAHEGAALRARPLQPAVGARVWRAAAAADRAGAGARAPADRRRTGAATTFRRPRRSSAQSRRWSATSSSARDHGSVRIVEPFLAAWLVRDMRGI